MDINFGEHGKELKGASNRLQRVRIRFQYKFFWPGCSVTEQVGQIFYSYAFWVRKNSGKDSIYSGDSLSTARW